MTQEQRARNFLDMAAEANELSGEPFPAQFRIAVALVRDLLAEVARLRGIVNHAHLAL